MALNYTNSNEVLVAAGRSGSGKSTLANLILLNGNYTNRGIFDPEGEFAERLGQRPCSTVAELNASMGAGWTVFDPTRLFPGSDIAQTEASQRAFESFCEWYWVKAAQLPGRKILQADEIWKFCKPNFIPMSLRAIVQNGRKRGVGLLATTQTPNYMHETIIREATEFIGFRLEGRNLIKFLGDNMPNFPVSQLESLPFVENVHATCIAQNRLSGVARRYDLNFKTGRLTRLR